MADASYRFFRYRRRHADTLRHRSPGRHGISLPTRRGRGSRAQSLSGPGRRRVGPTVSRQSRLGHAKLRNDDRSTTQGTLVQPLVRGGGGVKREHLGLDVYQTAPR